MGNYYIWLIMLQEEICTLLVFIIKSDTLHAPVESKEPTRFLLAPSAQSALIIEWANLSGAYLYRQMDKEVFMKQPTDSSSKQKFPRRVCKKSICGLHQGFKVWGSLFFVNVLSSGFKNSTYFSKGLDSSFLSWSSLLTIWPSQPIQSSCFHTQRNS